MPSLFIDCPSCGLENKFDDNLAGQSVQCRKCGETFDAEIGGSYDLAGPPSRRGGQGPDEAGSEDAEEAPKTWLEPWPQD